MHYRTNASAQIEEKSNKTRAEKTWNLFGIKEMSEILPEHFGTRSRDLAQIITIIGNSGLYKSDIAINALLNGVREGESGLIVRLSDRELFRYSGVRLSTELYKQIAKKKEKHRKIRMDQDDGSKDKSSVKLYKFNLIGWKPDFAANDACLYEVAFKSGVFISGRTCRRTPAHHQTEIYQEDCFIRFETHRRQLPVFS